MADVNVFEETTLPSLPSTFGIKDQETRKFCEPVRETIEIWAGLRGDPLDQVVTYRDLYLNGLLNVGLDRKPYLRMPSEQMRAVFLPMPGSEDTSSEFRAPPAPTGFTANGGMANVLLQWDTPRYQNHAYTEVWRAATDDQSVAVRIGTEISNLYQDSLGQTGQTRYYWIRHISTAGREGPFNAIAGTVATTGLVGTTNLTEAAVTIQKIKDKRIALDGDTWTDNSPSAGYVAWSAMTIVYNGTAYSVGSGNTSQKWIYWTAGSASLTTSAGFPSLAANEFLVAVNNGGTGDLVWNANGIATKVIDTLLLGDLVVGTAQMQNAAVTGLKVASATIDDGHMISLSVAKLIAGTITAAGIYLGASQIELDGVNKYIVVRDAQASPVDRVKIGKLGAGTTDYGIIIRDAAGNIVFGSSGADWTSLLNRPANLSALLGSEAIKNTQITISGNSIQGIGTGDGTAVVNSGITVNANGTLSGAGAGQVTIGGLGFSGALDATRNVLTVSSIAPGSPTAGDLWFDTANYAWKVYVSGSWNIASDITANKTAAAISGQGAFATLSQITAGNISTYIASAAIGNAYIVDLHGSKITAASIAADRLSVSALSAISADMGSITAGTIALSSAGHIRSGQTAFNTGTGFWLGIDSGTAKFSIGNPSGNYLTWNGTALDIKGGTKTYQAGATVLAETTNASGITATSYTKIKAVTMGNRGTVTVTFNLRPVPPNNALVYGRIYVNDVAVGTERSHSDSSFYASWSENIAVNAGDVVQLYGHKDSGAYVGTTNLFRVAGVVVPDDAVTYEGP